MHQRTINKDPMTYLMHNIRLFAAAISRHAMWLDNLPIPEPFEEKIPGKEYDAIIGCPWDAIP